MKHRKAAVIGIFLLVLSGGAARVNAQKPLPRPRPQLAPATNISVDGNEAMFTTMCALYAAGYEADVSSDNWSTFRSQIRERARQQQGPAVEAVREFYTKHQLRDPGVMLSRYVWFGLVAGSAPKFEPVLRRDELPPEVLALEGFSEILSNYYQEQKIGHYQRAELWGSLRNYPERGRGCAGGCSAARVSAFSAGPFADQVFACGGSEASVVRAGG